MPVKSVRYEDLPAASQDDPTAIRTRHNWQSLRSSLNVATQHRHPTILGLEDGQNECIEPHPGRKVDITSLYQPPAATFTTPSLNSPWQPVRNTRDLSWGPDSRETLQGSQTPPRAPSLTSDSEHSNNPFSDSHATLVTPSCSDSPNCGLRSGRQRRDSISSLDGKTKDCDRGHTFECFVPSEHLGDEAPKPPEQPKRKGQRWRIPRSRKELREAKRRLKVWWETPVTREIEDEGGEHRSQLVGTRKNGDEKGTQRKKERMQASSAETSSPRKRRSVHRFDRTSEVADGTEEAVHSLK